MKRVALIGFMGSGKSTIGPLLADALDRPFFDLDEVVTAAAGMTVAEIFGLEGETGWRRREGEALHKMADRGPMILSCGGGVILSAENRALLVDTFLTVYLRTSPDELLRRLRGATGRPLLDVGDPEAALRQLYEDRLPIYENAADLAVLTDKKTPRSLAREILVLIKDAASNG